MSSELKTSVDWQKQVPLLVLDPDGWDRLNFEYSWYEELITYEEFNNRAGKSTTLWREGFE